MAERTLPSCPCSPGQGDTGEPNPGMSKWPQAPNPKSQETSAIQIAGQLWESLLPPISPPRDHVWSDRARPLYRAQRPDRVPSSLSPSPFLRSVLNPSILAQLGGGECPKQARLQGEPLMNLNIKTQLALQSWPQGHLPQEPS